MLGVTPCSRWSALPVKMTLMLPIQLRGRYRHRKQKDLPEIKMGSSGAAKHLQLSSSQAVGAPKQSQIRPNQPSIQRPRAPYAINSRLKLKRLCRTRKPQIGPTGFLAPKIL